jgi:hypothetical protein
MSDLVKRLRGSADDPMWADHAEISKTVLTRAADRIEQLEAALREVAIHNDNITKTIRAALAPEQDR